VTLEIETIGDERFVRGFNRYAEQVKDWRPAFEDIYQSFTEITRRNFASEGRPESWAALSPGYAKWKAKHYPGKPIMQRTRRLIRSLTGVGQASAQDTIKDIKPLSAEFGTMVPYATYHQQGRGVPRRKVVQLTEGNRRFWARIIHEWAYRETRKI
jgi:phage gpG-like protein